MIKEETVNETRIIKTSICDFCGKESPYTYSPVKPCQICEKDVCPHCAIEIDSIYDTDLLEPYSGDYPSYICKLCWAKGETIRKLIMKIRGREEEEETRLIKQWEDLCKSTK